MSRVLAPNRLLLERIILQAKELQVDLEEVRVGTDPKLANRLNHKVRYIRALAEVVRARLSPPA